MERTAKVVEKHGSRAVVLMRKHLSCEKCGRCGGIFGGPDLQDSRVIVKNPVNAEVGQRVVVAADDMRLLIMTFVLYIVPVIALLAGIFGILLLADTLGIAPDNYLAASAAGFLLMAVSYAGIRAWDNKKSEDDRYYPEIVSIAPDSDCEGNGDCKNKGEEE